MSDTRTDAEVLAAMKAQEAEWDDEDERILAAHGGDPDAANRALGLENQARKWNEEARTSYALREGTENRRVHDRIMGMDAVDRAAEYPWPDEEDAE
ncbi:MAG: hypothetical protein F4Y26_09455 [Gammaproteobacteria bacterium]|nr:hypothetical protein [Gammaproteobacteria bacterium]